MRYFFALFACCMALVVKTCYLQTCAFVVCTFAWTPVPVHAPDVRQPWSECCIFCFSGSNQNKAYTFRCFVMCIYWWGSSLSCIMLDPKLDQPLNGLSDVKIWFRLFSSLLTLLSWRFCKVVLTLTLSVLTWLLEWHIGLFAYMSWSFACLVWPFEEWHPFLGL